MWLKSFRGTFRSIVAVDIHARRTRICAMLPAHHAQILFIERSAEASHIETEGGNLDAPLDICVLWLQQAPSYIAGVLHRSILLYEHPL